jgi:hypothetical protein
VVNPVVLPDGLGVLVPGALCGELAATLDAALATLTHRSPVGTRQPRPTPAAVALRDAARQAAVDHSAAQHRAAVLAAPLVSLPSRAHRDPRLKSNEITTDQAATLCGFTPERWRRLAASGRIPARKTSRDAWLLDRHAVLSYDNGRRDGGGRDGDADPDPCKQVA